MRAVLIIAVLALAGPSFAQGLTEKELEAYGDGEPLDCTHLAAIDEARQRDNQGFDQLMAAVSTMTLAGFCGDIDLAEKIDERIRTAINRLDDRVESLTPIEEQRLKDIKVAYVTGRIMLERSE